MSSEELLEEIERLKIERSRENEEQLKRVDFINDMSDYLNIFNTKYKEIIEENGNSYEELNKRLKQNSTTLLNDNTFMISLIKKEIKQLSKVINNSK